MAIKAGSLETVKREISKGLNPNIIDSEGYSLFINALRSRQIHICQYLLEIGVDLDLNNGLSLADLAKKCDAKNTLNLWHPENNDIQEFNLLLAEENEWISENETTLPPNNESISLKANEYQAAIAEWALIDQDATWGEVDIQLPTETFSEHERCAYHTIVLKLIAKADIYGVIDPMEIKRVLENSSLSFDHDIQELAVVSKFIINSLGYAVESCENSGYSWPVEIDVKNITELDWNDFFTSIYKKKMTSHSLFQKDLQKANTISREDEKSLFDALILDRQNTSIREKILISNLRFAYKTATEFGKVSRGVGVEDRISEAMIGLMISLDKFDVGRDLKFISYAIHWIKAMIHRYMNEHERNIRIPANKMYSLTKFNKALKLLDGDFEKTINLEEFCEYKFDLTELWNQSNELPLDSVLASETKDYSSSNDFIGKDDQEFDYVVIEHQMHLKKVMQRALKPREYNILNMYYGFAPFTEHTYDEIGRTLQLTRERVRQIKKTSISKLKKALGDSIEFTPISDNGI